MKKCEKCPTVPLKAPKTKLSLFLLIALLLVRTDCTVHQFIIGWQHKSSQILLLLIIVYYSSFQNTSIHTARPVFMCVLTSTAAVESADPEPAPQPEVAAPPQVEETPAPTLTPPPPPPPQQPEVNSSKGRVNSCCTHYFDELAVTRTLTAIFLNCLNSTKMCWFLFLWFYGFNYPDFREALVWVTLRQPEIHEEIIKDSSRDKQTAAASLKSNISMKTGVFEI